MRPAGKGLMRRSWAGPAAGLAASALILAGCMVQLPQADHPEDPGHPWSDAEGPLWIARDLPCGLGHGAEEGCATLTLFFRDGAILHATYGEGGPRQVEGLPREEGNRSGLTFANAQEDADFRDEVTDAWTAMHGAAPDLVRVHTVRALRLDPTEREDVLRVFEHAVDQATPLPEATFDCQDCSAPIYWTFGEPQRLQAEAFGSPPPDSDAWRLLEDQMQALLSWMDAGP